MRNNWNYGWEFCEEVKNGFVEGKDTHTIVDVPHSCVITPYHHWDASLYQKISGYRRKFYPELEWMDKKIEVLFMGVAHEAKVYLNGEIITSHSCGYTEFKADITKAIKYDKENILAVIVDSNENLNIPPFGFVIDYMTYGGIYRDVFLEVKEKTNIEDVFFSGKSNGEYSCRMKVQGDVKDIVYHLKIQEITGKVIHEDHGRLDEEISVVRGKIQNIIAWNLENPKLYMLSIEILRNEQVIDLRNIRVGFRDINFVCDGFYLNGEKVKIRGLNRHQSYPYVGYAMPASMQKLDVDILKYELGVNAVRTSHYPQSHDFIDRCDEQGILVFTEIPGWQHIGDEKWKEQVIQNTKEMVVQYRNHVSIILWGVRINESQDDDELYTKTNQIAHELDDTRPTTGVRFFAKSNLLEDVYAFNDFSHTGKNPGLRPKKNVTSSMKKGYLVSECNGHMFPTKPFDNESHRLSHALRHAAVIESMYASEEIAGVFGWCMFDYNTHKDFGSGDGICYHGVMDMFRNPKLAAAVYQSQSELSPVCEISSSMDIGEHPAGIIGEIYAFTNADSVRLYKNDEYIKEFFPDRKKYKHMPHPPILIDDFIGDQLIEKEGYAPKYSTQVKECLMAIQKYGQNKIPFKYLAKIIYLMLFKGFRYKEGERLYLKYVGNWGGKAPTYRLEAIKDEKVIKIVQKKQGSPIRLLAEADHLNLSDEQSYDVALIRIKAVDEFGNIAPYYMEPVILKVEGDIKIIGPDTISLKGGTGGTYVKTVGNFVSGKIFIEGNCLKTISLTFQRN